MEFYKWLIEIGFLRVQGRWGPEASIETISPYDTVAMLKSLQNVIRQISYAPNNYGPVIKMLIADPDTYTQMNLLIEKYHFQHFINIVSRIDARYVKPAARPELLMIVGLPNPKVLDTVLKCNYDLVTVFDPKSLPPRQVIPEMYQFPNEMNSYIHVLFIFTYVKGVLARILASSHSH
jgi:hypothetical protein